MKTIYPRLQIVLISLSGIFLFTFLYLDTFKWMYERFTEAESYYSHGFLVPFIAGYLIYTKRHEIKSLPIEYSYWGLLILSIALFIHFLSVLSHVYFISGFSILIFVFGIYLFLVGPRITKIFSPGLFYLIFMFPLPLLVIQNISLPLKFFVTHASVGFTNLIGIPVVQTGFLLNLSDGVMIIGNPCSGLRSIFSFLALGTVFVVVGDHFLTLKKVTFLLLCIPIALLSNLIRVVFLIITGSLIGVQNATEGSFYHDFSGYAVFLLGLIIMNIFWKALK